MTLRRQKKPSGKWCLPDVTLKRSMTGPPRKQSRGWRFRLAKPGFYDDDASLTDMVRVIEDWEAHRAPKASGETLVG
jgi:hypothetical protein